MTRVRSNTDNELVNLRINLEEAKNENVTILQVSPLDLLIIHVQAKHTLYKDLFSRFVGRSWRKPG